MIAYGKLLLIIGGALSWHSAVYAGSIKNCKVTFKTIGEPVLVQITGHSEIPCQGSYDLTKGELKNAVFTLDLTKLDTGITLRNRHLRENYLHTDKYPESKMIVTKLDNIDAQRSGAAGDKQDSFVGTLELHGASKPTRDGRYQIKDKEVSAEFAIDLNDYGIESPSFMGIKIVDKIYTKVGFEIDGH